MNKKINLKPNFKNFRRNKFRNRLDQLKQLKERILRIKMKNWRCLIKIIKRSLQRFKIKKFYRMRKLKSSFLRLMKILTRLKFPSIWTRSWSKVWARNLVRIIYCKNYKWQQLPYNKSKKDMISSKNRSWAWPKIHKLTTSTSRTPNLQ